MQNFREVNRALDRMNDKLDLILELVQAQKAEDWARVKQVCEKLDKLKKEPVLVD